MDFCLSSLIYFIKESIYNAKSDEELLNLLIEDIVKKLSLENKSGELFYIDKSYASKIMNRKVDIPGVLRKSLSASAATVDDLEIHMERKIIPILVKENMNALSDTIIDSVKRSDEISDIIKADIVCEYENGNIAKVLAIAFRTSIMLPNNKKSKEKNTRYIDKTQIPEHNNIVLRFFNDEKFTAIGAATVMGTWIDNNEKNVKMIELLTGVSYVDFTEEVKCNYFDYICYDTGKYQVNNLYDVREKLIEELYEKHMVLVCNSLMEIIKQSSYYDISNDSL